MHVVVLGDLDVTLDCARERLEDDGLQRGQLTGGTLQVDDHRLGHRLIHDEKVARIDVREGIGRLKGSQAAQGLPGQLPQPVLAALPIDALEHGPHSIRHMFDRRD
ncbi:MAG: hypothetical protein WAR57_15430 [Candidatus Phosphoribacter sp.]|nr:hypothetical protein [Actinomycetales bacterium]